MASRDFLLEIGTEEIPARMAQKATNDLAAAFRSELATLELSIARVESYVTPRRLVLAAFDIPEAQEDRVEEKRGPAVRFAFAPDGTPTKAGEGFARSVGRSMDSLDRTTVKGEEYLLARLEKKGAPTAQLLEGVIPRVLMGLRFPKSMRWGSEKTPFVRPVHWIVALFGNEVVPFEFAGVPSGNQSRGHRFMGPREPFTVSSVEDYSRQMAEHFVVLSPETRRQHIVQESQALAQKMGLEIIEDEGLLDTVTHLAEYPVVLSGTIAQRFLQMPDEVLISCMKNHQKYFSLKKEGKLAGRFIVVSNTRPRVPDIVVRGNERVLGARLEDALFFYTEDRKKPLESYVESLKGQTFLEGLGSMADKSRRVARLAELLSRKTLAQSAEDARRAGWLCKADLATLMVFEFPELQGIMGQDYARESGENDVVATAIMEHYLPKFSGDALPSTPVGTVLALADRLDTLAGCFHLGLIPTATKDPYALRRAALAILRILAETPILLPLESLLSEALEAHEVPTQHREKLLSDLMEFISGRLKHWLASQVATEVADAALAGGSRLPHDVWKKSLAIDALRKEADYGALILPFKRTLNITRSQAHSGELDENLLSEPAEKALWDAFKAQEAKILQTLEEKDFQGVLQQFLALKAPIDRYFEEVLVLCDDEQARNNHLAMLSRIGDTFLQFADFTRILA